MKVAITGASGFIGSHLAAHLESEGHEVLALERTADGETLVPTVSQDLAARHGRGNLRLQDHLEGVEGIAHLAARQQDNPATPLAAYLPSNVLLTETLLRAASEAGVGRFVLASSRMVYPSWIHEPISEDCPDSPDSFYGLSKRIAEDLVTIYSTKTALSGVSLRIGQVFGAGDKGRGVLPGFIETVRRGEPPSVAGTGAAVRDFVDVRDVVSAIELALERSASVPAMNIGGGRGYSIRELAIAAATAGGMDESAIRYTPVEHEDRSHYSLDCTLAGTQLGWAPARSLLESIQDRLASDR
ncbi:MAG: NAD-dependent epimerase/dehydratase family protein [Actinomycetota bacterium]|nr:NAD-dependent epimerase/dehydratase family protein [Actinomycetota bacterium]